MKSKLVEVKVPIETTIEDVAMEPNPIKLPPDVEIPPDPNEPVEK